MIRTMMPREEGVALAFLSEFDSVHKEGLDHALSRICGRENNQWYLNRMVRQMKIFANENSYLASPRTIDDTRIEKCFWVLMQYIDTVDIPTMQREREPEGVSFLRSGRLYRIMIANPSVDATLTLIDRIASPDVNLIIIVRQEEEISQYSELKHNHCFATVKQTRKVLMPLVNFYTKEPALAERSVSGGHR